MSAAAETINVQEKLSNSSLLPERTDSSHLSNGEVNLFAPDTDEIFDDEVLNGTHEKVDPRVSTVLKNAALLSDKTTRNTLESICI